MNEKVSVMINNQAGYSFSKALIIHYDTFWKNYKDNRIMCVSAEYY